jgi:cell shape-determining protein MreC
LYERQNEVNRLTEELQSAREENQKLRDSLHWAEHKIGGNVEEFG